MKESVLLCLLLLFVSATVFADTIYFDTDNPNARMQRFNGVVETIEGQYVNTKFFHNNSETFHKIHVSRVYAIYFNQLQEHPNPYNIRNTITEPILGNLKRHGKVYVTEEFQIHCPNCKVIGNQQYRRAIGNIVQLSHKEGIAKLSCINAKGSVVTVEVDCREVKSWERKKFD